MNILAFDASSSACSVALLHKGEAHLLHEIAPMMHAQRMLPMIHELLENFSLSIHDLDAIAYGCGPGSFTGIRIATSVAQGLGYVAKKPILCISSLAILAQTCYDKHASEQLLVAVDARMGQVYWASYCLDAEHLVTLTAPEALQAPDSIPLMSQVQPGTHHWHGVGDGWALYEEELCTRLGWRPVATHDVMPHATALLKLAVRQYAQGNWTNPQEAMPVYLR